MKESNPSSQKRSDDASTPTTDETKSCPECGDDIMFITRRGPSTATAQPCGHSLGGMRVRDAVTDDQRVATDGGQPDTEDAVYFRVEGISPDDVGDDFLAYANEIFSDLSESYDVTGVVPVINEDYDPRLRSASFPEHTPLQEFAAWLSGEFGIDATAKDGLGVAVLNASPSALRDINDSLEDNGFNTELYLDEEPPALHVHPRPGDLQDDGPDEEAELVSDGGVVECEVERDQHSGDVQIVLDEGENVLAMCAKCRGDCDYRRVIDENPGAVRADGGVDQTQWRSLTAFQQECMKAITRHAVENEVPYGLAIKRELERRYGEEINHGRLYPNLDDLQNKGLVEVGEVDKRTNSYELTDEGRTLLQLALAEDEDLLAAMTEHTAASAPESAVQGGDD